jgi:multidrug efflux pump subunit AcrB
LQLVPDEWRIARSGLTRTDVAAAVRAFTGGIWAGEYFDGNDRLDIIVKSMNGIRRRNWPSCRRHTGRRSADRWRAHEVAPDRRARTAPAHQRHRTVSVVFQPPEDMTLDAAIGLLETQVEPKVRAVMGPTVKLAYAGSVNDLHEALRAMGQNFLLALVILFALMAALFRSARDSLLVMVVIPVSVAGGILALRAVGFFGFQALDLLTMIGFIILLGLVVNAAILLVDQTRARERAGLSRRAAVAEALETRARPIVLSTLTAVLGMAPLIFMPGARCGDLPRPGGGGGRWHDDRNRLHLAAAAKPVAARGTAAIEQPGAFQTEAPLIARQPA